MSDQPARQQVRREAGRVVLLDEGDRVFLFQGVDATCDPAPVWWFTPGGGLDPGETHEQAARREAREELGVELEQLDGPVHERRTRFTLEGVSVDQHEFYFVARITGPVVPDPSGWSEIERRSILGSRWWTLEELRTTAETVYPQELPELVARLLST